MYNFSYLYFSLNFYIFISIIIYIIGIFGLVISNKNIIMYIICFEILFISININFISGSLFLSDVVGELFIIGGLVIAGCETAIGLAFILALFKRNMSFASYNIPNLKAA